MDTLSTPLNKETKHAQNEIAAVLTVVPGLGHIYKGHFAAGFLWMFFGMPLAIWIGILFRLATAGVGPLFPIWCWVAWWLTPTTKKDRRHHHLLPPKRCARHQTTMSRRIDRAISQWNLDLAKSWPSS